MDANALGSLVPILVPLGAFALTAVLVGMDDLAKHRSREMRHQTIRLLVEKVQPIPPELLQDPVKPRLPGSDLTRGVKLISLGVGVSAFLYLVNQRFWALGLVFLALGVGHVVAHRLASRPPVPASER